MQPFTSENMWLENDNGEENRRGTSKQRRHLDLLDPKPQVEHQWLPSRHVKGRMHLLGHLQVEVVARPEVVGVQ